ncbi:hypothetical protein PPERSA_03967 [Pseudocohnilembus persalinus]|uniref:Uncharacterized protein n=1 Tax=Pseudocohnilembus persalinus TaxID=266149 RepID=A0A0V0QAJ6_PSEPJ|nr:hypothetical protein PPERSA_03967 [Pseudocohnilembus persalinus]|eukprot:KRW99261.1 hypothetical protein PPERSA_03967 [Pseudocohnilembus persalinus]
MDYEDFNINEHDFFIQTTEIVSIKPTQKMDKMQFICGDFGPFTPPIPIDVPLWLALYLKDRNRCQVIMPEWFNKNYLEGIKKCEQDEEQLLAIGDTCFEIGFIFIKKCYDDIENPQSVELLLKEIEKIRDQKIQDIIRKKINKDTNLLQLNNITRFEINKYRNTLAPLLQELGQLRAQRIEQDNRNQ